jgi:large subunit ribosomal protein L4
VVLDRDQDTVERSFRNLPEVKTILSSELNAYDVLCCDWIVFTKSNVPAAAASAAAPTAPATATASTGDDES